MALVDEKLAEEFCLKAVPHLEALLELAREYKAEDLIWVWLNPQDKTYKLEGSGMGNFNFDNYSGCKTLHTRHILREKTERKEEDGGV